MKFALLLALLFYTFVAKAGDVTIVKDVGFTDVPVEVVETIKNEFANVDGDVRVVINEWVDREAVSPKPTHSKIAGYVDFGNMRSMVSNLGHGTSMSDLTVAFAKTAALTTRR